MPPHQPTSFFIKPDMPTADEILPFLQQIDINCWYTNFGPLVLEFEKSFSNLMRQAHNEERGKHFPVTVTNGYQALAIGLRILGVGKDDNVLIPSITFPACPLAVHHAGATPLLSDIDAGHWTLTPAIAKNIAARHKIKAVMPVAVYGVPVCAKEWDAFFEETKIPVIIDAAAAVESQRYLRHGMVAHSLHAVKPFGIGEGGILVAPDKDHARSIRQYTNFGTRNRIAFGPGENSKMSEYHAAVGLAQLKRWKNIKAKRKTLYENTLSLVKKYGLGECVMLGLDTAIVSSFMLKLPHANAPELMEKLLANDHAVHRTYLPPLYHHPYYENLAVVNAEGRSLQSADLQQKSALMTQAEILNQSVLGIPFHPNLDLEASEKAIKALVGLL